MPVFLPAPPPDPPSIPLLLEDPPLPPPFAVMYEPNVLSPPIELEFALPAAVPVPPFPTTTA